MVAVGYRDVLFYHELAYAEPVEATLERAFGQMPRLIRVPQSAVPLEDTIASYLFNSQLVETAAGRSC